MEVKLSNYPYVILRLACTTCDRKGRYRIVRLASAFGPEATIERVVGAISADCPWRVDPRKYGGCGCYALDLMAPRRPPDLPADMRVWTIVKGGKG